MDDSRERTLYITNLDDRVTEEILYELFLQAGPLNSVNVKRTSHQFAFIEFKHEESVPYALALFNGLSLFDKPINIKPRDNTEMAKKLFEASSIARNMHKQEQAAAISHLQQLPKWPLLPSGMPPLINPVQFYAQLAIAQTFNPMSRGPLPPSPPPPMPLMAFPPPPGMVPPPLGMVPPPPWQQFSMPAPLPRQSGNDYNRYEQRQSRQSNRDEPRRDRDRDNDSRNLHRNQSDKSQYDDKNRSRSRTQRNYEQRDYR